MKELLKKGIIFLGLLLAVNVIFFIFMYCAFLIPTSGRIKTNAGESLFALSEEDRFPIFHDPNGYWDDNGSDMTIMNIAVTNKETTLVNTLGMYYHSINNYSEEQGQNKEYISLISAIYYPEGNDTVSFHSYSRLPMLIVGITRILLLFYTIGDIRYIMYYLVLALSAVVSLLLYKRLGWRGFASYFIVEGIRLWQMQSICLTEVTDILVCLVAMIVILCWSKDRFYQYHIYYFGIIGAITYAMGFLVAPLITLGMPLLLSIILFNDTDKSRESWFRILIDSIVWVVGYGLSLYVRQTMCIYILGNEEASSVIMMWIAFERGFKERISMLIYCFDGLFSPLKIKLPILFILGIVFLFLAIRRKMVRYSKACLLLFVGLYPIVWIMIFTRHCQHFWVTNILCISVFALVYVALSLIKDSKENIKG